MSQPRRKILIAVGALLGVVVLLLALTPLLFGDRIANRVKAEVNQSLNARVDWRSAGLSLFRDFPNLTLRLDDLSTVGIGRFEGDTLASVRHLRVVVDLGSAIRSAMGGSAPLVIRKVELDHPKVSLVALEDGTANWDIVKETADERDTSTSPLSISLRRFAIEDGAITVDHRAAKLRASLLGFDQTLTGDFSSDQVDIETRAEVDTVTAVFAGIPYINGVRLALAANIAADLAKGTFTVREGTELSLNELKLAASGNVTSTPERLGLDLVMQAPRTDFKHILSLVPAVYARDFKSIQASGAVAVNGRVKGDYGDDAFPAFSLDVKVDNGTFRYPDLPLPARDIALDLAVTNPGGNADNTVVNLSRFHVMLGQQPVDAKLVVRTPISDPDIDARVVGTVDLADVRRTVKLEGVQELAGKIAADASVRTRMSWVDRGQYDRVAASGAVDISNLTVKSAALPHPLAVREASFRLAPKRAELRSFSGTVGSSDFRATGYLDNLIGYALRDEVLRGSANITSSKVNLDEWRSDEGDLSIIPVPPGIDFALQTTVGELSFGKLRMTDASGRLRVKDQRITLEDFTLATLGGQISASGFYETTVPAKPTFDVALKMQKLDIPSAFATLVTVQQLAPVAKYARGNFSTDLRINGPLGKDMMPLLQAVSGSGTLQTSQMLIQDFPVLEKAAAATKLAFLNNPTLQALRSQFEIRGGRFHVKPFSVAVGGIAANISGSNGLDQSLNYDLALKVPRSMIGADANQVITGLVTRAASAGINLSPSADIPLGLQIGGTFTNPSIKTDIARLGESVAQDAGDAARAAAEARLAEAENEARQRTAAEVQRLVGEAEARAEGIRKEARSLADKVKREGYQAADSLVARSRNPVARVAAEAAAGRLRKEADTKAARLVSEADARADALVAEARAKGDTGGP